MPVIAPVVNPDSSANRPAVAGPSRSSSSRHLHSAALSPSREATASWNRITAVLSSRPSDSPEPEGRAGPAGEPPDPD